MPNNISLKISPCSNNVFHLTIEDISVTKNLSSTKFEPFSQTKEFAGLSFHKKLLSVPKSLGPANFCGLPIIIDPDKNTWIKYEISGLLLNTDKPDICIGFRNSKPGVYVKSCHLISRYKLANYTPASYNASEYCTNSIKGSLQDLLSIYNAFPKTHISTYLNTFRLLITQDAQLSEQQWNSLGRHVYTDTRNPTFNETVEITDFHRHHSTLVWVPCSKTKEAELVYGIQGTPHSFNKGNLGFAKINVVSGNKASQIKDFFRLFEGKKITFGEHYDKYAFALDSLANNHQLLEKVQSLDFCLKNSAVNIIGIEQYDSLINTPLFNPTLDYAYCPANLVASYFYPLKEVCKKYDLTNIKKHRIFNLNKPKLKWVRKSDLENKPIIDRKAINAARKQRELDLTAKYGALPTNWDIFSDQDIQQHFEIQNNVSNSALVKISESSIISQANIESFKSWLIETDHYVWNKITNEAYITNFSKIDDLVSIPGFWDTIDEITGDAQWFKHLIVCKEAQKTAMLSLL